MSRAEIGILRNHAFSVALTIRLYGKFHQILGHFSRELICQSASFEENGDKKCPVAITGDNEEDEFKMSVEESVVEEVSAVGE